MVLGTRLRFHSRYFFAYHMSTTSKQHFLICFWAAMDSEVSCHILAMVLYYLTLGTRQSSRTLFPLFAAKTSSRIFDGFCKFSNKVAIPESKCLFGNRDGRLTRVAQQQLLLLHVWHFAVSLISQDENNSLLGKKNVHLNTNNSLMGSKRVFRDTSNSLLGTNNFLVEKKKNGLSRRSIWSFTSYTNVFASAIRIVL